MAIDYSRQLAAKTGYTFVFLETSAKTGLNIQIAFDIITNRLLKKFNIDINLDLPEGIELISPEREALLAEVQEIIKKKSRN